MRWAGTSFKTICFKISPDAAQVWRWGSHPGTRSSSRPRAQAEHRPLLQPCQEPEQFLLLATGSGEGSTASGWGQGQCPRVPRASCTWDPCSCRTWGWGSSAGGPHGIAALCPCSQGQTPANHQEAARVWAEPREQEPGPDLWPMAGDEEEEEEDTSHLVSSHACRLCCAITSAHPGPPCALLVRRTAPPGPPPYPAPGGAASPPGSS